MQTPSVLAMPGGASARPDPQRILRDNLLLHDSPGYPEFYDAALGLLKNPWEQRIIRHDLERIRQALPRRFRALDLGAGTGNITLQLLPHAGQVVALDLSRQMLKRLAAKARLLGPTWASRLELVAAPAHEYLRGHSGRFDLITACSVLHHLPDYAEVLARCAELLLPGGVVYVVHEPLPERYNSFLGQMLELVDAKWLRLETRLGLVPEDPYWQADCLADYWQIASGIEPQVLLNLLKNKGLTATAHLYDSKRHRLVHFVADLLGTRRLLRLIASKRAGESPPGRNHSQAR